MPMGPWWWRLCASLGARCQRSPCQERRWHDATPSESRMAGGLPDPAAAWADAAGPAPAWGAGRTDRSLTRCAAVGVGLGGAPAVTCQPRGFGARAQATQVADTTRSDFRLRATGATGAASRGDP